MFVVVGCCYVLFPMNCLLPVVCFLLLDGCLLFVIHCFCLLLDGCCLLFGVFCLLLVVCCVFGVVHLVVCRGVVCGVLMCLLLVG